MWSQKGKDKDEVLLQFVKEVYCCTGFKVGGKEICVLSDGGQNNEFRVVMIC